MTLLDKVPDPTAPAWYSAQDIAQGWSNPVLSYHISTDRYGRAGGAPNNFLDVMDPVESDQTRELLQDPYHLEFLSLAADHNERELEDALVTRLTQFLAELGTGFAFVGRQYKLTVGGSEYFIDLLVYHLRLRRFIVFELKTVAAQPEDVGNSTSTSTSLTTCFATDATGTNPPSAYSWQRTEMTSRSSTPYTGSAHRSRSRHTGRCLTTSDPRCRAVKTSPPLSATLATTSSAVRSTDAPTSPQAESERGCVTHANMAAACCQIDARRAAAPW
jgi:predicted nuclease of restriction endonuclease-like (RecB) superfamily